MHKSLIYRSADGRLIVLADPTVNRIWEAFTANAHLVLFSAFGNIPSQHYKIGLLRHPAQRQPKVDQLIVATMDKLVALQKPGLSYAPLLQEFMTWKLLDHFAGRAKATDLENGIGLMDIALALDSAWERDYAH